MTYFCGLVSNDRHWQEGYTQQDASNRHAKPATIQEREDDALFDAIFGSMEPQRPKPAVKSRSKEEDTFEALYGKTQPRGRMADQEYVLTPKQKQGQSNIFMGGSEDDGRNETYRNRLETQALRPKEGVGPVEIPRILFELPFSDSGGAVNKASGSFDIGMDFVKRKIYDYPVWQEMKCQEENHHEEDSSTSKEGQLVKYCPSEAAKQGEEENEDQKSCNSQALYEFYHLYNTPEYKDSDAASFKTVRLAERVSTLTENGSQVSGKTCPYQQDLLSTKPDSRVVTFAESIDAKINYDKHSRHPEVKPDPGNHKYPALPAAGKMMFENRLHAMILLCR